MTTFRRGYRVRSIANGSLGGTMGTVLNPRIWHKPGSQPMMTVRFDCQQEYENGYAVYESEVVLDTSGETQFDRRNYQVWLSHQQLALIIDMATGDMRPEAAELLKQLPGLPS